MKDFVGFLQWTYFVIANCSAVFSIFLILCLLWNKHQNRYTSQKRRTINLPYKQFVWILFEFEESLFFYPVTLWKGNAEIRTSSNLLQVLLLVLAYYLNPTISALGLNCLCFWISCISAGRPGSNAGRQHQLQRKTKC